MEQQLKIGGLTPKNQERKLHMKRKQHVPASKIT
jgi:hypothetical protein